MTSRSSNHARRGRPDLPVDEHTPGGRLKALRKGAKMGQEDLAQVLGVERPQISKYENGVNSMPDYVIERASQHFGVTAAFIRYGDTDARMARVVGRVGAGGHVEAIEQPPFRHLEVPASWDDAIALEVDGTSCWPTYDDGDDIVVRGERRLIADEIIGRMCVVETSDGLGLVKRVRRGTEPGLFTLESPNAPPIEDVALSSARPVRLHVPR
ncbi:MAG: helix-turn-helix domain-containing protein [Brevundimonas sp.]|uniref:XRE family transcriptional regulator n=1 Tax=Brevundimonas sp. TaxID=1871086 RepID=UPI002733107D|nr:helix-turn-helix domain-containing protein [Brevundimonas sp.]MDP3405068.1 helix-turn-helix domain-containing protein [Brevundimonas sp.]